MCVCGQVNIMTEADTMSKFLDLSHVFDFECGFQPILAFLTWFFEVLFNHLCTTLVG